MAKWTVNEGTQVWWDGEVLPEGRTIYATPDEIAAEGATSSVTLVQEEPEPEPEPEPKPKAKPAPRNKARGSASNK